jgi:ribonuclease HII
VKYLIGVDESGTGAWAGPFHVGAVAVEVATFDEWANSIDPTDRRKKRKMLNDSKAMADSTRRSRVRDILSRAITTHTVSVPVDRIADDHKDAWRWGVLSAIQRVEKILRLKGLPYREFHILIDGNVDKNVRRRLKGRASMTRFEHKADGNYPAVMAASILAKTARNDEMIRLDQDYPEFLWAKNAGYGTAEHWDACQRHGITEHHRPIHKLHGMDPYTRSDSWFEVG